MERYDAIVVGCGAMGSAVSMRLASKGLDVLVLERFGLGHTFGSSHGKTRIIRLSYYEDERYVPLLKRAYDSWRSLERASGESLLRVTGGLMAGPDEGELVRGVLHAARTHGLPHRVLSSQEVRDEFPFFRQSAGMSAVYDERAGVLFPEACVASFVKCSERLGSRFKFGEAVTGWKRGPEAIEVRTEKDAYQAHRVVFCAGAWTGKLLGPVVPLTCERQVVFWYRPSGKGYAPGDMPVFITEEADGRFFYGVPDFGEGVKVARTHGGALVDPESVDRSATAEDAAQVDSFLKAHIPGLAGPPLASSVCLYTNTPDLNFALGPHPDDGRVFVVSACSGHGFKFASVMGEVVGDMVSGDRADLDISFLRLDRFA
jgi:sarcosine oxidase